MNITVYSKPFCGGCEKVKELLTDKGVEFEVKDTSTDLKAKEEVVEMGYMSVPVTKLKFEDGSEIVVSGYEPDLLRNLIE